MAFVALMMLLQEPSATVSGTVRLGHRAPPPRRIKVDAEPAATLLHPGGLLSDELLVDADNRLAATLVYVKKAAPVPSTPGSPVKVAFQGFRLLPRVVTLRTGQELILTNMDSSLHNYHVLAYLNKETNVGLPSPGDVDRRRYPIPEIAIKAKCDVHPWESSWIHVFDHPFHSLTGADGRFAIAGLPPGRYTIGVWHERCKPQEKEIELKSGESKTMDLLVETEEGPPPFPWLKVGVGGGAVLVVALGLGFLLMGRRRDAPR